VTRIQRAISCGPAGPPNANCGKSQQTGEDDYPVSATW
jgi:hypothetical protein